MTPRLLPSVPLTSSDVSVSFLSWTRIHERNVLRSRIRNSFRSERLITTDQLFHAAYNVSSVLSFPNQSIYLLLTMPTRFEKEMERSHKLLAEHFDNEDIGPEDILGENL
ncbi:hypothetical protein AVEN_77048-1 [Araneus ventricosus]|uniref:Uncharacterized protein n=1 Tax=Araneus ventricosus TaxID=182803 RepID=A0A4Y2D5U0_ARAVE|nr:hypothetical protein AVEN_77048-1 [Araneus ventricosus]